MNVFMDFSAVAFFMDSDFFAPLTNVIHRAVVPVCAACYSHRTCRHLAQGFALGYSGNLLSESFNGCVNQTNSSFAILSDPYINENLCIRSCDGECMGVPRLGFLFCAIFQDGHEGLNLYRSELAILTLILRSMISQRRPRT